MAEALRSRGGWPTTLKAATVAAVAALLLVSGARPAWASHYSLDKADFVSAAERRALARAGIFDTGVLLAWTAPRDKRAWLARATRIAPERLEELARRCDLLRIRGVGPSVSDSLTRAGTPDVRALGRALAEPLLARMRQVTKGTPAHYRLPAEDTLAAWIAEARLLRPLIE